MHIRDFHESDLPALIDLTIEAFRPLFERHWTELMNPVVFAHDHGEWEHGYRHEVPALHDPSNHRYVALAEDGGRVLGYVGWNVTNGDTGRLEMVAVHPTSQRSGVGRALCEHVLERLSAHGVVVVHIGTGGDAFHAPARRLYESLGFTRLPVVDYSKALLGCSAHKPLALPDIRTYILPMTHHWRASDHLEPTFRPGEWRMYDRGYLVGVIQYGRANGRPVLRGLAPDGSALGFAATLEEACDSMWEWYRRVGRLPQA